MSSGFFVGSKRGKEVGVVIGRVQCLHEIQHNVGNKTYTNLACFESCFCSGVELAMTKNFSVRRNHSLVVGEITFQVTYMLLYCRIINVVFTSRHVSVVWSASDITGITYETKTDDCAFHFRVQRLAHALLHVQTRQNLFGELRQLDISG